MSLSNLNSAELANVASVLKSPADNYGNDETLEAHWAIKSFENAELHFNLLTSVDPTILKLSQIDNRIYAMFRKDFPDCKVDVIDEDEMKSPKGKEEWRNFCNQFEKQVDEWNFATLLRLDCTGEYSEKNTTIVPRVQFLAIEIARNREGYNSGLREKYAKNKTLEERMKANDSQTQTNES